MLSLLTNQTRSKYGPTLRISYVVLSVSTSRPLRLPYAPNSYLAGFTQLDRCLPQAESCGDAGTSGPTSAIFHRMPLALPRVPCRCSYPLLPADSGLLPNMRGSANIPTQSDLSLNQTLPAITVWRSVTRLHHSLYAAACGFGKHPWLG